MVCRLGVGRGCVTSWIRTGTLSGRLRADPPARVEPLTVTFKPKAKMIKARGRVYSPIKTASLAICIGTLVTFGLVFRDVQAVRTSAAMAAHKKGVFRSVSDYRAVNKQIEKVLDVMLNQEVEMADMRRATCFGKLDMLQGYCQMPVVTEAQEVFTIATPNVCLPPRVCSKAF